MKILKLLCLILGVILILASLVIYIGQVTSCYPSAAVWQQFSLPEQTAFQNECRLAAPPFSRFAKTFWLFISGISLFTAYWLWRQPAVKARHSSRLTSALVLMMVISLGVVVYGLLGYPLPWEATAAPAWVVEVIAGLGFLGYIGLLALWQWRRWGLLLFDGAAVALTAFLILGGGSLLLGGILIVGILVLTLFIQPIRHKLV